MCEQKKAKVFTVRGRTGAVVMMQASKSDDSLTASTLLANSFSTLALQQIQYVAADNPSEKYWQALRSVCPGVQALMLDTTHLVMTWEYANSRRRSKGSAMLRQVLKEFLVVDFSLSAANFGSFYSGGRCRPLDTLELKYQNWIEDGCMKNAEAERILKNLDFQRPFYVRLEWIQALAAIAMKFYRFYRFHRSQTYKTYKIHKNGGSENWNSIKSYKTDKTFKTFRTLKTYQIS